MTFHFTQKTSPKQHILYILSFVKDDIGNLPNDYIEYTTSIRLAFEEVLVVLSLIPNPKWNDEPISLGECLSKGWKESSPHKQAKVVIKSLLDTLYLYRKGYINSTTFDIRFDDYYNQVIRLVNFLKEGTW